MIRIEHIDGYLAGGFHTDWQDRVKAAIPNKYFFDPRYYQWLNQNILTLVEREALDKCGIVFAYLEMSNPRGFGLAAEVGYAARADKPIILVNEWGSKYGWLSKFAHAEQFSDFDEGLTYLKKLFEGGAI